jgi:hypothetical protein
MSRTVQLREVAFVRSGDKGNTSNVGVVPYREQDLEMLATQLSVEKVRALFAPVLYGDITRYEFHGISALNFVMTEALGGGVSRSLGQDLHGKAYASLMLSLDVEIPDDVPLRSER